MGYQYEQIRNQTTGEVMCAAPEGARRRGKMRGTLKAALILLLAVVLVVGVLTYDALAEESCAWVICQPGDWVNVRRSPGTRSESLGRLECGDAVWPDGKTKKGWAHVVHLSMELDEGWIWAGYISDTEPEVKGGKAYRVCSKGRVACRRWIDGPRIKGRKGWAADGDAVKVYYLTDEWAVTNRGYIRAAYLEE